jgi:hypothetical protein
MSMVSSQYNLLPLVYHDHATMTLGQTLVYVIYALCDHPEYIVPLPEEIASASYTSLLDPSKEMQFSESSLL